jgi:hypothetical protein
MTGAGLDPLAIAVDQRDAERFAALMAATKDQPTAEQIQRGYLDGAGDGVAIFTPQRIQDAENLSRAIAADRERYRYAIDTCLPHVAATNAELRATYLAFKGLLPEFALPQIFVVFGAGNSGGTANARAQVIGLEVICGPGTTIEEFRRTMRSFYAHETVHTWQTDETSPAIESNILLYAALREGTADYIASLVTGYIPDGARNRWACEREAWLWQEFQADRAKVQAGITGPFQLDDQASAAMGRWVGNYGNAPEGWPHEAGYWVGMRIARAFVEGSPDRTGALRTLIALRDPAAILAASGYDGQGARLPCTEQ